MLTTLLVIALAQSAVPASGGEIDPADGSRVVCKKIAETGSLVKSKKVCMSEERWSKASQGQRRFARRLVEDGAGTLNGLGN